MFGAEPPQGFPCLAIHGEDIIAGLQVVLALALDEVLDPTVFVQFLGHDEGAQVTKANDPWLAH